MRRTALLATASALVVCMIAWPAARHADAAPTVFVHPGVTVSKAQLDFARTEVNAGAQPWKGAFDQMVLYKIGIPKMEQMYGKKDAGIAGGDGVKQVLTELKDLKQFTDSGYANRNWNDTTNLVITGKAGLQIMGDWARGEFAAAGMTGVKDFGCMIGLDEDNPIVSTDGDVVVFPKQKDPDKEAAQKRLAALLISPKVQVAFNNAKGSMPVRGDVDMATADPCMQKALKAVDDPKRIATGVQRFITEDTSNQLNSLITQYWADDSMTAEAAQKKFADIIKNSD